MNVIYVKHSGNYRGRDGRKIVLVGYKDGVWSGWFEKYHGPGFPPHMRRHPMLWDSNGNNLDSDPDYPSRSDIVGYWHDNDN